jgi:protein SSD1
MMSSANSLSQVVADRLRETRIGSGADPIAPLRLLTQLDDENIPVKTNLFDSTPATEAIDEIMVKVNAYVAQRISQTLPDKALLRRHAPPNPRRLQTFVERMTALGYEIDATSSGSLQNSLFKVDDAALRQGMETLLVKSMQRAKYAIAGRVDKSLWAHYGLNLPVYTHFTSPTRRYADILVHRQLEAVLSEGRIQFSDDMDNLVRMVESCNTKKDSAQNAQEQSMHVEACRAMDKRRLETPGDLVSEGIVLCVYESAFDVLIPEFGFEKRVHCDQLPLQKAEFRKEKRVLELYWEKGVPSSAYIPEDERPKAGGVSGSSQRLSGTAARQAEQAERAKKERAEQARKQTDTGSIPVDAEQALLNDEDDGADLAEGMAGVSLVGTAEGGVSTGAGLERSRSGAGTKKYSFTLRERDGEYIQDVREMTRVPIILKTDLTKSPP